MHLEEKSLLYVPAGWIVAEDVVNQDICFGVRWLFVPPTVSSAFGALCEKVLPSYKTALKPSSAVGFLHKIFTILNSDPSKKRALESPATSEGQNSKAQKVDASA